MNNDQHFFKAKPILACASCLATIGLIAFALEGSKIYSNILSYLENQQDWVDWEKDFYFSETEINSLEYEYYDLLLDQYGNMVGYIYLKNNQEGQEWSRTRIN